MSRRPHALAAAELVAAAAADPGPARRAAARILGLVDASPVPEDPAHARSTLAWLLRLEPRADLALRLAALAHDLDRAVPERVRREGFADYDAFKAAHARRGARLLGGILAGCGLPAAVAAEACRLVARHEFGGDGRADLLREADSLSFYDTNLPLYLEREGPAEALRRARWGWRRLSARGRELLRGGLAGHDPASPAGRVLSALLAEEDGRGLG